MQTLAKFDSGERIEPSIYLSDGSRPLDKEAGGWAVSKQFFFGLSLV